MGPIYNGRWAPPYIMDVGPIKFEPQTDSCRVGGGIHYRVPVGTEEPALKYRAIKLVR